MFTSRLNRFRRVPAARVGSETVTHSVSQAGLVRSLAGAPAGFEVVPARALRNPRARRGSFLVLVVGTLAVLSVFAIIYVTIGNQDARLQSSVARRASAADVPVQVRDYVGSIIANDTLSTWYDDNRFVQAAPNNTTPVLWREAMDYPFTGFDRRSNSTDRSTAFDPTGSAGERSSVSSQRWSGGAWPAAWQPSDPFLASSEPAWVRWSPTETGQDTSFNAIDRQDWMHISNLAPDGRFVNLVNLRGNFAAEAGVGNGTNGLPRLSNYLSVMGSEGASQNTSWFGAALDPNVPAHFDSWQRFLFRPAKDLSNDPGARAYLLNQYCDADGDGMLDSRWFELTDNRGGNNQPPANLLETNGNYRYFFAARVVDLSSRINVNTATDQLFGSAAGAGPTAEVPIGLTPADVDLHRLLTLTDTGDDNNGYGYDSIYNGDINSLMAGNYGRYDTPRGLQVGTAASKSLRLAHAAGEVPALFDGQGLNQIYRGDDLQDEFALLHELDVLPRRTLWDFSANPIDRWKWYMARSGRNRDFGFDTGNGYSVVGPFGLTDLSELLTRNGVNDAEVTSNLEKALTGRDDTGPGTPPISFQFDPLRSNRTARFELSLDEDGDGFADPEALLRHSLDPRHRLTTLSGGRALRNLRDVNADFLGPVADGVGIESKRNIRTLLTPGGVDVEGLFEAYVSVLMPHANEAALGVWDRSSGAGFEEWRTAFYGYDGPELSAYISAFMALNMADLYDADQDARSFTLVLDDEFRDRSPADTEGRTFMGEDDADVDAEADFEQWQFPAWIDNRRFDLGAARLTSEEDDVTARAVNLFGVDNQPFITQVATFTVYSDSRGGEGAGDTVKIDGKLIASNEEALYRVLAFQLTNPFGTAVTLSGDIFSRSNFCDVADSAFPALDREDDYYYIEFDGKFYKLSELVEQVFVTTAEADLARDAGLPAVADDGRLGQYTIPLAGGGKDITIQGISIPAGETIVCYALSNIPRTILGRIADNDPDLIAPERELRATIVNLIEDAMDQSDDVAGAYWIPEFTPADGRLNLPVSSEFRTLVDNGNATAHLWRTVRVGKGDPDDGVDDENDTEEVNTPSKYWDGVAPADPTEPALRLPNRMFNDRLVDRFRSSGLNRKLSSLDNEIGSTNGTDHNRGLTLTLWATTMRPSDPLFGTDVPRGAFPGYCMEPKYRAGWNVSETDGIVLLTLNLADFNSADKPVGTTVKEWRDAVTLDGLENGYVTGLAKGPNERPSNIININSLGIGAIAATEDYAAYYPEIYVANDEFRSVVGPDAVGVDRLRVADTLLPWGIGPMQNPVGTLTPLVDDFLPDAGKPARWTTLSEAMAMVLGYDTGTPAAGDPLGLYQTSLPDPAGGLLTILDRGHLRLDGFVGFFDDDADLVYTPGYAGGNDTPIGLGSPMAYGVLDAFTAITPGLDSYTKAQAGTININTAPLMVMRALPMLSPPPEILPNSPDRPWWWWPSSSLLQSADVAASLLSFRDKMVVGLRPSAAPAGIEFVSFADFDSSPLPPDNLIPHNGRSARSDIIGVREQPGFQSFGELLGVRYRTDPAGTFLARGLPISTDFLGNNTTDPLTGIVINDSRVGVDSVSYSDGPGGSEPDEIGNEYDEQLAIINGLSGSVSTRSDYFAVWFVMHGYRESDVAGLDAAQRIDDPLVPSIARRFVVVYDRSNVTRRGDQPRVVLFKEVPL